jgi:hypothetical protein
MQLEDLRVRLAPEVGVREWVEAGDPPVLARVYETPAGTLTSAIKQHDGWPYGDRLPLFSDYITPRAVTHPVTETAHLAALRYLLTAPGAEDSRVFLEEARRRKRFAEEHGVALAGGWRGVRAAAGEDPFLVGHNFGTACRHADAAVRGATRSQPKTPEFLANSSLFWMRNCSPRFIWAADLVPAPGTRARDSGRPLYQSSSGRACGGRRPAHQAGSLCLSSAPAWANGPLIIDAGWMIVGTDPGRGRGQTCDRCGRRWVEGSRCGVG